PLAIHADRNVIVGEHAGEGRSRELRTLICIEDVRLAVTSQSILQHRYAERRLHGDRQPPRQHATAEPVEHNGEIDKATRHRDVGVSIAHTWFDRVISIPRSRY